MTFATRVGDEVSFHGVVSFHGGFCSTLGTDPSSRGSPLCRPALSLGRFDLDLWRPWPGRWALRPPLGQS